MEPGSVLWDIGANVGAYSLYAARRGLRVLAFEPAANTFCALMGNIQANRLEDRVGAYCIALAERAALDALNMSRTYASSVHHAFGETVDSLGESIPIAFRQPTPGLSVDAFREIFALPAPDHIKLDVDSIEEKILRGAENTLSDPRLKSLLMEEAETMPESNARIAAWMAARGFARRVSGRGGLKTVNVVFERAGI